MSFIDRQLSSSSSRALSIARGVVALAQDQMLDDAVTFARARWPGDQTAHTVARSAVVPASTTDVTTFNQTLIALADILGGKATASGGLFQSAHVKLTFGLNTNAAVWVIGQTVDPTAADYVEQGAPIKFVEYDTSSGVMLEPKKMAFGIAVSRELLASSNADVLLRMKMREDLAAGIEAKLFDNVEGTAVRPSGLLFGVDATAATSDMVNDLAGLAATIAPIAGDNIAFVGNPKQVAKIRMRVVNFPYALFSSNQLADGTVVAVATNCLCVAGSDVPPRLEVSKQATVHLNSAPEPLSSAGTPPTVPFPVVSMLQHDLLAIRLIADGLSWGMRASGGVAYITGAGW